MGHDDKLFPILYPYHECRKCHNDGDCSQAYKGGPGKYCGIVASSDDNYQYDGSSCCCPVESECQMTSWECLCEGSKEEVMYREVVEWAFLFLICFICYFESHIRVWLKGWIDWCCPDRSQQHEWDDDNDREPLMGETDDANNTTYQATSNSDHDFTGTRVNSSTYPATSNSGYDFTGSGTLRL
ncbi:expressed unknown protein [Seminavis robusta]|uniref:Uncharacterized protein n=1 Tax=Seminavis robusta TaxID=568900 RepID=A0A9N8DSG2_9STRA|nr:expressed unknown protein [Seminavis robusta]|eukprot:Sro247_g098030.1 n/a (184) ;mRNA; r:22021-22572